MVWSEWLILDQRNVKKDPDHQHRTICRTKSAKNTSKIYRKCTDLCLELGVGVERVDVVASLAGLGRAWLGKLFSSPPSSPDPLVSYRVTSYT